MARKESQTATQILRAGSFPPGPRGNLRKWGPGKGEYEHEVLILSRPRRQNSLCAQQTQSETCPLIRHGFAVPPSPQGEGLRAATWGRPYEIQGSFRFCCRGRRPRRPAGAHCAPIQANRNVSGRAGEGTRPYGVSEGAFIFCRARCPHRAVPGRPGVPPLRNKRKYT